MAQDRVEAVERALTVLEAFDSPQDRFTLAELATITGFYKST
ncbi:MAG: helix-turn-helix domain-containing protein, partial [Halomonas sp.]|nr:helix-turn-helix domain-containing protein [Halomonas sp.]